MSVRTARIIRTIGTILFLIYVAVLVYVLFFSERYGRTDGNQAMRYNLMPLREIRRFWSNRRSLGLHMVFLNLFGNILIFIPFAAILPVLFRGMRKAYRTIGLGILVSLWIEMLQLVTRVGSFDVDDILLNAVGCAAGYVIFAVCNQIRRRVYG